MTADDSVQSRQIFDRARRDRSHLFDRERFQGAMADDGFDAVVALSGMNVSYTGGVFTKGEETPDAVLTRADGAQILISAEDYAMCFKETTWIEDVRPFRHNDDIDGTFLGLLAEAIDDLGLAGSRIGIEGPLRPETVEPLRARAPRASWGDARPVFDRVRRVKTPGEIELYRAAMRCTQAAVRRGWAESRAGDTEKTVAARIQAAGLELGADWTSHCQMQSGPHSTVGMAASLENPLREGEVVHVDYGGIFCGYRTDFARNASVVKPTPAQASIYARLADIQHHLLDSLQPGMPAAEVWALNEAAFRRSAGLVHPWALVGHGIGLEIHEGITLSAESTDVLEPGMLINVEPSHFEPGDARYHIEDTVVVTESGVEILANAEVTGSSLVSTTLQIIP
ncbi:M24 family metallopeptidase [Amycolatopsis jejuensis]|uniref:M24 family metallopeptidase n=1 Tax=Amycolatopsis jejuensis TaxID=330084 RepID=UPI000526FCF3|nr:Xaa-Pro peptidase family protein [Amycolatopsis jejuensis]